MSKIVQFLFPLGRRSLLWGVHQVFWHPWTVYKAWKSLYGRPTWREAICIIVHDWGYWSSPNMDGPEGQQHPEAGAKLARWLLGPVYGDLVLYHSRNYVEHANARYAAVNGRKAFEAAGDGVHRRLRKVCVPSKLCWADKLSVLYDPPWFYLLRARLTGELQEYRARGAQSGFCPAVMADTVWLGRLHAHNLQVYAQEVVASGRLTGIQN